MSIPQQQPAKAEPKSQRTMTLRPMRPDDEHELPVEIDLDQSLAWQLRKGLELINERDFNVIRANRAEAVAKASAVRLDQLMDAIEPMITECVHQAQKEAAKSGAKGKPKKYVDVSLGEVGMPDIMMRVSLLARQDQVIVEDEVMLAKHFTKDALPTDRKLGCFELVPASWKFSKSKLNELAKENRAIPGVKVSPQADIAKFKEKV